MSSENIGALAAETAEQVSDEVPVYVINRVSLTPHQFTPAALEMYKAMIAVALTELRHW